MGNATYIFTNDAHASMTSPPILSRTPAATPRRLLPACVDCVHFFILSSRARTKKCVSGPGRTRPRLPHVGARRHHHPHVRHACASRVHEWHTRKRENEKTRFFRRTKPIGHFELIAAIHLILYLCELWADSPQKYINMQGILCSLLCISKST